MKLDEVLLLEAGYSVSGGYPYGEVDEWLKGMKADKDDLLLACVKAKDLQSYKKLIQIAPDQSTPRNLKFGSFVFRKPKQNGQKAHSKGQSDQVYIITAVNGRIRSQWGDNRSILKSPKPRLVAGNPVKSILMVLDTCFKEVLKKAQDRDEKTVWNTTALRVPIAAIKGVSDVRVVTKAVEFMYHGLKAEAIIDRTHGFNYELRLYFATPRVHRSGEQWKPSYEKQTMNSLDGIEAWLKKALKKITDD